MSKILYSVKNVTSQTLATSASGTYIQRNQFTADGNVTTPTGTTFCVVKMWGQGGANGSAGGGGAGAGGAAAGLSLGFSAAAGDAFYFYMNGVGAGPRGGGAGGDATILTKLVSTTHTLYGIAAGGGAGGSGGSAGGTGGAGGAGGITAGTNGSTANGTGGGAGNSGTGGSAGTGGSGAGSGTNFSTSPPVTSGVTPPTWSPTGNGGAPATGTGGAGGGGGGGYGGGGGGGAGTGTSSAGGGGAGAASFIYSAVMTSSTGYAGSGAATTGPSNDSDYTIVQGSGYGAGGAGGGFAVIYFYTSPVLSSIQSDNSLSLTATTNLESFSGIAFKAPTVSSSVSKTVTNAYTVYIPDVPVAGTNTTITNAYPLYVGSGTSLFAGPQKITSTTAATSSSTGALIVAGGIGIGNGATTAPTISWGTPSVFPSKALALYDNNNNNYQYFGLGVSSTQINYTVDASTSDHVFYAGATSSTRTELLRIKGTGRLFLLSGSAGTPSLGFVNESGQDTGIYNSSDGVMDIACNGTRAASFANNGISFYGTSGFRFEFNSGMVSGDILKIYQTAASTGAYFYYNTSNVSGTISDRRVKENIVDVDQQNAVNLIKSIRPRHFTYKKNSILSTGFIAQELLAACKQTGNEFIDIVSNVESYDENDPECPLLGVSMTQIVPVIISTLQAILSKLDRCDSINRFA